MNALGRILTTLIFNADNRPLKGYSIPINLNFKSTDSTFFHFG